MQQCLRLTEQSLRLARGMISFVFCLVCPGGVVIVPNIAQALLLASVSTWLGLIMSQLMTDNEVAGTSGAV